jgi:SnoaL-like domain
VSERNVDLWRSWIADFNARDIDAVVSRCDPGIEFHSVFAAVGGAVYHGHDGLRAWHRDLEEAWGDEIYLDIEAYFDLGEETLTFFVYRARGKQSEAAVTMPATVVTRWRNGLVTYIKVYVERADALKDLGVSEDELEEMAP